MPAAIDIGQHGYRQYEVSAYCRDQRESKHNLNYWHFGDYVGIGAGAHGKITLVGENRVIRRMRQRQPRAYLASGGRDSIVSETTLAASDLCFEFMLNALRLKQGFASSLFHQNTGLELNQVLKPLETARNRGLIEFDGFKVVPTQLGFDHLNELQLLFLDSGREKIRPIFDSTGEIMHN